MVSTLIFSSRESFARDILYLQASTYSSGYSGGTYTMKARLFSALVALGSLAVIAGAGVAPFQHW